MGYMDTLERWEVNDAKPSPLLKTSKTCFAFFYTVYMVEMLYIDTLSLDVFVGINFPRIHF